MQIALRSLPRDLPAHEHVLIPDLTDLGFNYLRADIN
jgi:hypothetical protein